MWFSKQGKKNYPFTLSKFKKKKWNLYLTILFTIQSDKNVIIIF